MKRWRQSCSFILQESLQEVWGVSEIILARSEGDWLDSSPRYTLNKSWVVFWFWGFCTVCEVNFLTTFREPLWVPSSMVIDWRVSNVWPLKMGLTAAPKTSSRNLPYIPCKIPKTKNQYSFHGESLKSRSWVDPRDRVYVYGKRKLLVRTGIRNDLFQTLARLAWYSCWFTAWWPGDCAGTTGHFGSSTEDFGGAAKI